MFENQSVVMKLNILCNRFEYFLIFGENRLDK